MANPNHDPRNGEFTTGPSGTIDAAHRRIAEIGNRTAEQHSHSIMAHHGSPNSFDRFDVGKAGATTDSGYLGEGVYLSTDPVVSAKASNQYDVEVSLSKPLKISLPDFKTDKRDVVRGALNLPTTATAKQVTAAALAKGYDGVVLDYSPTGYKQQEIAAFKAETIKIIRHKKK